jgi:hypothetical protein
MDKVMVQLYNGSYVYVKVLDKVTFYNYVESCPNNQRQSSSSAWANLACLEKDRIIKIINKTPTVVSI